MTKDPAFLFYTGDFSTGTQFFSDEQVGKYMRLLLAQHQHGHLTEKQMLHICKSHDEDVFAKFAKDQDGKFFNERLDFEIHRRKNFTDSRSKNKLGKTKSYDNHIKNISKSYGKRMENENENENINKIKDEIELKKDRQSKFSEKVKMFGGGYDSKMVEEFVDYWTESSEKGQMRFEKQTVFDIGKRLVTWNKNAKTFSKETPQRGGKGDRTIETALLINQIAKNGISD